MIADPPSPDPHGPEFHLSVVATSRNDDHGGGLLRRMQSFVDGLIEQSRHHRLSIELILVEWNPPADRPPLAEALRWPAQTGDSVIRIVTVPAGVHARLAHGDRLPLFQMIAKNVGIRRARGRYVLATNVDILFSDSMMRYLRDDLVPGRLYRADRCDVPTDIPAEAPLAQILEFCQRRMFRINTVGRTLVKVHGRWRPMPTTRPSLARRLVRLGGRHILATSARWGRAGWARAVVTGTSLQRGWRGLERRSGAVLARAAAWLARARRAALRWSRAAGRRAEAARSALVVAGRTTAAWLGALSRAVGGASALAVERCRPGPHVARGRRALARLRDEIHREGWIAVSRSAPRRAWYRAVAAGRRGLDMVQAVLWLAGYVAARGVAAVARGVRRAVETATWIAAGVGRRAARVARWFLRLLARTWRRVRHLATGAARWTTEGARRTAAGVEVLVTAAIRAVRRLAEPVRARPTRLLRRLAARRHDERLFTNACGDFTLLSREDWFALRGYPEWEIFSWHVDSVLLYQANRNGIREVYAGRQRRIFHIEHGTGSGYTPEGAADLFARLDTRGIPYLTWPGFLALVAEMDALRAKGQPVIYNPPAWGLAQEDLPDRLIAGGADDIGRAADASRWSRIHGRRP